MSSQNTADDSPRILREHWYKKNMDVTGQQASVLASTFVTDSQLLSACNEGEELTEYDGIGRKTAGAVWKWYRNVYGATVEADGTLVLDDDGLETPDWLVGYSGTVVVKKPTITMRAGVNNVGETSGLVLAYPESGGAVERLSEGQIALSTPGNEERIYDIDDQRMEEEA